MHDEVKRSMKKEYIRRVKTLYPYFGTLAGIATGQRVSLLNWIVRPGRKLFSTHGALHPRCNVSRLYLPREGGGGLISVEDAINIEERNINVYISQSQERLLKAVWKRKNVDEIETPREYKDEEEKN